MTILNCIIYAIGIVVLAGIFSLLLVSIAFAAFDRIMSLKKKQPFEDTALGQKLIYEQKKLIDGCKTAEDAQIKVWEFCENQSCDEYSNLRKIIIAYFERKFGVKNVNKNDVIKKALVEYLKENYGY